jgi:hypothetical protein
MSNELAPISSAIDRVNRERDDCEISLGISSLWMDISLNLIESFIGLLEALTKLEFHCQTSRISFGNVS